MSQQLDALREFNRIPILSSLSEAEIFDFIRACRIRRVGKGETLFRQGDTSRSMFIVGEGGLEIFLERGGARERLAALGPREVVGELSLLDPQPRSATAIASAETTVYEVLAEDFDTLLRQDHPAAYKIARGVSQVVCRRIRAANARIEAELGASAAADRAAGARPGVPPAARGATGGARPATGSRPRGTTTGAPIAVPGAEPRVTGAFRRVLSRFWGDDE